MTTRYRPAPPVSAIQATLSSLPPSPGSIQPVRVWVLGDSGTADSRAAAVRDAYKNLSPATRTDVWLMLGDNAYSNGEDAEYQDAVFDMYPDFLKSTVLWPALGNHDGHTADSETESGPYYDIFDLPRNAEAGGVASHTEAYYSFDYANIHFICLDSYETDRSTSGSMHQWLESDLSATGQPWIIVFWHHPPYSKGSHDSDTDSRMTDMRENFLPLLEQYGVDLVLSGHGHSYERSYLIDGHYGTSDTFDASTHLVDGGDGQTDGDGAYSKSGAPHKGSVYVVAGSSGQTSSMRGTHPVMIASSATLGSLVLDINDNRLDARFLTDSPFHPAEEQWHH
ncbi:metallophosphoesterase family protein, partial [Thiolapillus sp.]